ncbi:MAG: bifunctional phosphoribosylaminoimidazolecarboxamide formyltransferase/IMP cyclohydrolase [Synergistaceae bacterium]|jgi:phosphoribosylaminoimidazolecarboxamide formyltransferase/IMP cyclohydrolase|nr:bifunctional phosphoribosylaminoimidazolecarboxamide formyltransferase/IMP cyclohydrolase [Synergistaceae bacterium]
MNVSEGASCAVKRALLSVSDKRGIVEFAAGLAELGVEIVSTGGTHKTLDDAGIPVLRVSDVTGFPEILNGRVKTLHPVIHGGLLARRDDPQHRQALEAQGITPIDLAAVNLYPFRETAARGGTWEELIENIDIGGPAMIRSAAKNHEDVIVIVRPDDYDLVLRLLRERGNCPKETRLCLALQAFQHTADYDAHIHAALSAAAPEAQEKSVLFPEEITLTAARVSILRYGENPNQAAALYRYAHRAAAGRTFIDSVQLQGKELSYNNWLDAESAFRTVQEWEEPAAVVVKHNTPCGAALGASIEEAFKKAYETDPVSAFGGVLAVNRLVTKALAEAMSGVFWEVLIAPDYSDEAREFLAAKPNLRLLEVPEAAWPAAPSLEWRSVQEGLLVQERDLQRSPPESWTPVTVRKPEEAELRDLVFAWKVVKSVKSNAIVLAKDLTAVGIGAGQTSRVGAVKIALEQAGEKARKAVLASDAFFPFADAVLLAAEAGVSAIVQPGGSLRDRESTEAADARSLAMLHTGIRHFRH